MIVKDEENNLPRAIRSVKDLVDEMIVVDTGSTDKTVEAAKALGAQVYFFEWNDDFSAARNFSLSKATGDWILLLDADDELESTDKWKIKKIITSNAGPVAYYGRTICYSGEEANRNNAVMNSNVRLIKNHQGLHFEGRIHEQIKVGPECSQLQKPMVVADIKFHHYGYLKSAMDSKDKHHRNVTLIERELENDPDNPFMLFSLGNEYYSMHDYKKALECYMHSFASFDPAPGFSPMLIVKIVMCHQALGNTEKMEHFIDLGLKYYPRFTDFELFRADFELRQKKTLKALSSYRKCLRMGEPPQNLNNLDGSGTFKPHYTLSVIYTAFGETDKAIYHCTKAIRSNPTFTEAYASLCDLLLQKGRPPKSVAARLEKLSGDAPDALLMLSDIFYDRRHHEEAALLAGKSAELADSPKTRYYEGVNLFYLQRYAEAAQSLLKATDTLRSRAGFLRFLCSSFSPSANIDCRDCAEAVDPYYYRVALAYRDLVADRVCSPFSDDTAASQSYLKPIFDLLGILLKLNRFEDFQKSVKLLNLVRDDTVLLRLAKLYYANGLARSAMSEFMRSLKLTGKIDSEGLEQMKRLVDAGVKPE